ncbi:hypothetical protein DFH09DRAFT_1320829 [Mycena vulgaris]|nr:hypothetical protein DFH09DRAFT_1320829 [Mycena vulgaris]
MAPPSAPIPMMIPAIAPRRLCAGFKSHHPGTIPVGKFLYHGHPNSSVPTIPEWTATDPEHAYPFCVGKDSNATEAGAARGKDGGTNDAQDVLVWGEVDPSRWHKPARIDALCANGHGFVMICDFTAGLELVAADFLTLGPAHHGAPAFRSQPLTGETRIALDLIRLVSFYNTDLAPSLVARRAGLERRDHRVQSTSDGYLAAVRTRLRAVLAPSGEL